MTIYEYMLYTQKDVVAAIEKRYGRIKIKVDKSVFDDPTFRFFDHLMRQIPRRGK
jgi:hypothetical protein